MRPVEKGGQPKKAGAVAASSGPVDASDQDEEMDDARFCVGFAVSFGGPELFFSLCLWEMTKHDVSSLHDC